MTTLKAGKNRGHSPLLTVQIALPLHQPLLIAVFLSICVEGAHLTDGLVQPKPQMITAVDTPAITESGRQGFSPLSRSLMHRDMKFAVNAGHFAGGGHPDINALIQPQAAMHAQKDGKRYRMRFKAACTSS